MNVTTRKLLIRSLNVFLVCLIASAVTPMIFAEDTNVEEEPYWGNLKVGDEMHWKDYQEPWSRYYELKILELQGESLKVD
jgi:hypothetical protein